MNNLRPNKLFLRLMIIFIIHLIVVTGDQSMDVWELSMRRALSSVLFLTFWVTVWYIASFFSEAIHKKQNFSLNSKSLYGYLLFFSNFVFGFIAGVGYNLIFRFSDIYFFQMDEPCCCCDGRRCGFA